MAPDRNQSLQALYQIPANMSGFVVDIRAHEAVKNSISEIRLLAKPFGLPPIVREILALSSDATSAWGAVIPAPRKYPEKTLLALQASSSKDNTQLKAGFTILLVAGS